MDQQKERFNKNAASAITEGFLYALSNFYISGYYVDLKNEKSYAIGQMAEYRDRYGTENDTSVLDAYIRECVHEDDRDLMTKITRFDYMRERLKKEKSYSVEIRDYGTGKERWYRYTVMRGADEDHAATMFVDVTEQVLQRKEMQRLTAELQEKLRIDAALGQEYTGIFMINCDDGSMKILKLDGNQNAASLIKEDISYDDFRKNYLLRFALPEYSADVIRLSELPNLIQYFKDGHKDLQVKYRTRPNQAGQSNFELYVVPFLNGNSNQIIFGSRCIDATISKEAEYNRKLQEANDAMANAGYGMWHIILKDGVEPRMQVNEKMAELLGIAGQDLTEEELYHAWYDQIVPDAIPSVQASVSEMLAGKFSENTYQWVHPTKGVIYVRCGGTAKKLEDGTDVLSGYHADVTDIVNEEEQKKAELERQIDTIGGLSNAYTVVCGFNKETNEFFAVKKSNELQEFLKRCNTVEEAVTRSLPAFVVSEELSTMKAFIDIKTLPERLNKIDTVSIEYKVKSPDERWNRAKWIVANRDENGNAYKFLYIVEDITDSVIERKKQENELKQARDQAEAANAAKTSFLFNMSHDIRTPMNAIMGFRDLLEKHQDEPEKRQDYLKKIQDSSGVLLSIINNVLEMARIEKGTLEIEETAWSTEQFNDTLYSVFHAMMEEKGLTFTRQIVVQHHYVYCDPTKLREIFLNILSNAYKYTNAGGSVNMHLEEIPSEREGWVLYQTTISDTGIGMSEEFLPHIFEEFSRENNTTDAKVEGTGLGMPIVKRLVKMLDGTIEVKSKKGEGSTFIVTIPHRIADKANLVDHAGVEIDPKLFEGKHILLAEDNDLNAEIAMEILGEAGFKVDRAEDGAVCVDMLEKAEAGYYDLILMDIQMPNMNGYEAAKAIRLLEDHDKANIKILAMTANAFEEDKREALRAGMNGHLAKPINVKELMKTLAGILE